MSEAKEAKSKKKEAKEPRRAEQEVEAPEAADPLDALVLAAPGELPPNRTQILRLQRKVGNRVVSRLLDRYAAAGLGGGRAKAKRRLPATPATAQATIQRNPDPPTAHISWHPRRPQVRHPVELDGSHSSDPQGDVLSYFWDIPAGPTGGAAAISEPHAEYPTFTPDVRGAYVIRLRVENAAGETASHQVRISTAPSRHPEVDMEEVYRGLRVGARPGTFAEWFLRNRRTLLSPRTNPTRVMVGATSAVSEEATFSEPTRAEEEELRELYNELESPTDRTAYFARQRAALQQTVDFWANAFPRPGVAGTEQGETGYQFMDADEYRQFHTVYSMGPPGIVIPPHMARNQRFIEDR